MPGMSGTMGSAPTAAITTSGVSAAATSGVISVSQQHPHPESGQPAGLVVPEPRQVLLEPHVVRVVQGAAQPAALLAQ